VYPVTTDFLDKMKADRRRVVARVEIDYTDPFMDQSLDNRSQRTGKRQLPATDR
jgi:hypothetical protein